MKYCVIILDGASGWPIDEIGGRTTLQLAQTPHLDRMAAQGLVGLAHTVPAGVEPSSAAACMSILGYDPVVDFVGRGAIEAASLGIDLGPGEVALRLNLVTVEDGIMESYACGHIATPESRAIIGELAEALSDDTFKFHSGVAYRHVLVVRGHPEIARVVCTPPHDISDKPIEGRLPCGPGSDLLVGLMERARPILAASSTNHARAARGDLSATDIWPFWPGVRPSGLVAFRESRRVEAGLSSGVDLLGGLAALTGIRRLEIPGVTDGPDNDYRAQAEGSLAALDDHDLVIIHIESPDEAGHSGDIVAKVSAIEAIDREVVARAADRIDTRVLAMPDHPTPIALKTHVGEPVPFVLWGPGIEADVGAHSFDEEAARLSGIVVDPGRGVMDLLLGA